MDLLVPRRRIAVIGSGISGLACAHVLGPHHEVVLYEADRRLGGHTNTLDVDDPVAGRLAVDTGFIVHNEPNYPNLVRLFRELGVATVDTDMSFGVTDRDPTSPTVGFTYRASNLDTLFADRRNLANPTMWRLLSEIARFYRRARKLLAEPDPSISLDDFLDANRFSRDFVELHLRPMGAAVWSADPSMFGQFPAITLLTFLKNHGLLGVGRRPVWRTIPGGSRTYVDAIAAGFSGQIRVNSPVTGIERSVDGCVMVSTPHGIDTFDAVVLAVHSDQALNMLTRPTPAERAILGAIRYQPNRATLHTDASLLSPVRKAWAAWNYDRREGDQKEATVTYDMTTLQHLPGSRRYLVSLNSDAFIDPASMLATIDYAHPLFDRPAIEAQRRFETLDGVGGVHFCGAWWGHGFHEDGITSALRVCERLGVRWNLVSE
ncbi:MAG TPA: FAD-dependent oxidoreductase, partial [Ilumatobacteraceae bacterium]|nr:FAD-dependent oxidoreductase [Ilumatobacteraceae bacterium]